MRILYILNKIIKNTGNTITTFRTAELMRKKRHVVSVISFQDMSRPELFIKAFKPDVIHTYHAYWAAPIVKIAKKLGIKVVLTITGTDINIHIKNKKNKARVLFSLNNADSITVFHKHIKEIVPKEFVKKVQIVPQSVVIKKTKRLKDDQFRLVLVSNIREVKNNIFAVSACKELKKEIPELELVCIGKVLDRNYARKFIHTIRGKKWINYCGEIDHDEMAQHYSYADVILNTSHAEGGMANSLLEAMYLKIPVVASAIAGNKTIVKQGKTGLLFKNKDEFKKAILRIYKDDMLRKKITSQAAKAVKEQFSSKLEREGYLDIYKELNK